MDQVYSHLSEEERQVVRIELGNGSSVAAQEAMFSRLPAAARTGATHDDGTELARHAELRDEPGMATYFADPYGSWRRGGNENRNRRRSSTKPTTGPCERSPTAPPPRHSPTNC